MRIRAVAASGLVLGLLAASPSNALARRGLTIGFSADPALTQETPSARAVWISRASAEGAGIVRVNVNWSQVAPSTRPAEFDPADPASPGYSWGAVDSAVRQLTAAGLQVLINITYAPGWAEGADPPPQAQPGTWRPDPVQFGEFAEAVARRYSGEYPDPSRPGSFLPRVRDWQAWNEPNLSVYLAPQWQRNRGRWMPASPVLYRRLLNAFYAAVKRVNRANFVVAAGTAPYGDPPGGQRMPPVSFDRGLFCLRESVQLTPTRCADPPHLDAISHHPYAVGGPLWRAFNPGDVAVADVHKLTALLHAAERFGHVLPRGHKRVWVTEISWDSSPPDPHGVPIQRHARWLEQAMYVLWSQGVDTVLWLQIVDSPPIPNYASTYQAGLYYLSGEAKPAAVAFRFPFVTRRVDPNHVQAWGRSPQAGELKIEVRHKHHWVVLRSQAVARHQVFLASIRLQGRAVLRAELDGQASLTWVQRA